MSENKKAQEIVDLVESKEYKSGKPRKQKWSWSRIGEKLLFALVVTLWVFVMFNVSQYAVGYGAGFVMKMLGEETVTPMLSMILMAVAYTVAAAVIIGVPAMVGSQLKKKRWQKDLAVSSELLGIKGLPTWIDIGLGVVGLIVALVGGGILLQLMEVFPWFDATETQETGFAQGIMGIDRIWAFIALAIIAPIAEELIFRGWMYGKLREKMKTWYGVLFAMLLVSALFGFLHGQWNVAITVGFMSLIMCALREVTGTIWAPIIVHMLKNGIAAFMLFVYMV